MKILLGRVSLSLDNTVPGRFVLAENFARKDGVLACILDNTVPGKFVLAENFARKGELVSR